MENNQYVVCGFNGLSSVKGSLNALSRTTPLRFSKVRDVKDPNRGSELSAGIDFFIPNDFEAMTLRPNERILIMSGIHVDLIGSGYEGYALIFQNKSGVSVKRGLVVGACVVDADYQGELGINLINTGLEGILISPGEKIVQAILTPVVYATPNSVDFVTLYTTKTERGSGGFGSTGAV